MPSEIKPWTDQTNAIKECMLLASKFGARLFRRNVGMGWIGQAVKFDREETVTVKPGDVLIRKARPFHNGITGQSDTYGWKTLVITQDMVGQKIAQHVEIEVKVGKDRISDEQTKWNDAVEGFGGIAGVARSVDDVERLLG